jgi:hypothetical protein
VNVWTVREGDCPTHRGVVLRRTVIVTHTGRRPYSGTPARRVYKDSATT